MNSAWKWKATLALLSSLFAFWLVLPNFLDEDPTEQEQQVTKREWYSKLVPNTRLKLGLDLQGGVHMVLGIDMNRAMVNEADRYIRDLKDYLPKKDVSIASISRDFNSTQIKLELAKAEDSKTFERYIEENFPYIDILEHSKGSSDYLLDINSEHRSEVEKQTIDQALATLRRRLDEFGVAEPTIQAHGTDQIVVQLPGLDDPQKARRILGRTAQLEFKLVDDETLATNLEVLFQEAKAKLPKDFTADQLNRELIGKIPSGTQVLVEEEIDPTTKEVLQTPYLLKAETLLTGDMLEDARIGADEYGNPIVQMTMNAQGAILFEKVTGENVGRRMAIVLDDKVQSAPQIRDKIGGGRAQISLGEFKPRNELIEEAKELSMVLRAGALPAPVEIRQNSAVGPSLGRDSIERGLKAMLIGVFLVILFMAFYYRVSGIMADIAVVVNILFTFACLGALHATLTLPGIAGIIISVGMAVDANVIIYERIREELKTGKSIRLAIEAGYERAHLTIIDSNLTTIITGLVLLEFGTGPIKGFAITMIFGLIANYFTALWFTRLAFEWITTKFQPERLSI